MTSAARPLAEETLLPDEGATTAKFIEFLKSASLERHRQDPKGPIRRFNQARDTACLEAELIVPDTVPEDCRVGLFARARTYPAFIRFANAGSSSDKDKDVRGLSITVRNVEGENLTPGKTSHDFVLNSHPVMVSPNAKEFMELLQAMEAGGLRRILYFLRHARSARIGLASRQHHTCHLDIRYWSATPYLFGPGRAVKYVVVPTSGRTSTLPSELTGTYLRDAMRAHLAAADATFDFMVQFQRDAESTPIEDASVEWSEQESPYRKVAQLRIPKQSIDDADRMSRCETAEFNPWHCLAEHRPLGNMNRARRQIYPQLAALRRSGQ